MTCSLLADALPGRVHLGLQHGAGAMRQLRGMRPPGRDRLHLAAHTST